MESVFILKKIEDDRRPEIGRLAGEELIVGRDPTHGLKLDSAAVSREHGAFVCWRQYWFYRDLGSTNGSWVNGSPVAKGEVRLLRSGDVIQLADFGIELAELEGANFSAERSLIVLSRGNFDQEFPIPEFGRTLVVGGPKADLKLDVDVYELPSLVVERRGPAVCAYSIAKEAPVKLNGKLLEHTVVLTDRDQLEIGHYTIIFNDVPDHSTLQSVENNYSAGADQTHASARGRELESESEILGRREKVIPRSSFGRAIDESKIDETVTLDPSEISAKLGYYELPAGRRRALQPEEQDQISFESLENKILLAFGAILVLALVSFAGWWLLLR